MAEFLPAYRRTMKNEGGDFAWSNNPNDPGRETVMGISRVHWPDEPVWAVVDAAKTKSNFPRNLSFTQLPQLARDFYKRSFWDALNLDRMANQEVAEKVFDIGVNASPKVAASILQRALNAANKREKLWPNLPVDGAIGDQTLEALEVCIAAKRITGLMAGIRVLHGSHYMTLMQENERLEEFYMGWLARAME